MGRFGLKILILGFIRVGRTTEAWRNGSISELDAGGQADWNDQRGGGKPGEGGMT